jgi:hypothetical protein
MKKNSFSTIVATSAVAASLTIAVAGTAFAGPQVNININGFLPPPPGVHVLYDAGRPYYVERGRRVYMERDRRRHHEEKRRLAHEYRAERGHERMEGHDRH